MISSILVKNITNITELKKNPVVVAESDITCVLSNGKPCFYTVSVEKMQDFAQLINFNSDNEVLLLETIIKEMTGHDVDSLKDDAVISKDLFKRIVISLAVNFAEMRSAEEIVEALEV